eukprot:UC1_evm1s1286
MASSFTATREENPIVVRFATIGTNVIVDAFLKAASTVPGIKLTAVYSRSRARGEELVARHQSVVESSMVTKTVASAAITAAAAAALTKNSVHVFTSLDELCACPDVDAVYVASPTSLHCEQSIALMHAGKHVLCEKPACSHADELERVLAAARASKCAFMEAMRPLKTPVFAAVREELEALRRNGTPVNAFSGSFCQLSSRWAAFRRGERPNAFLPDLSNGALMDLGCYAVYSAVALMGGVERVVGYTARMLDTGVDGGGTLVLKHTNGSVSTLVISKMAHSWNASELMSDGGTLRISHLGDYDAAQKRCKGETSATEITERLESGHANMRYEIEAFADIVRSGRVEDEILTWDMAMDVARVLDAARDDAGIIFPADATRKRN